MLRTVVVYAAILSMLAAYSLAYGLLPRTFILAGRPVQVQGVVEGKGVAEIGNMTWSMRKWYTLAIRLTALDPINDAKSGPLFLILCRRPILT